MSVKHHIVADNDVLARFSPAASAFVFARFDANAIISRVKAAIEAGETTFAAKAVAKDGTVRDITLRIDPLTSDERDIIADGCLMNYYKNRNNG